VKNKFIKILLVEDELTSMRILNSFLHPIGEVDIVVNGNVALTVVKKALENNQHYELIFLDIMMPKLDGISTLKKIRQLETQHGVSKY
jgi:two-component system chemotaxis response regulator CheY